MEANPETQEDVKFEEAMEIAGYGKFSIFIIFLSGLTLFCAFLSSMDSSFLLPAAQCDLQLTSADKGLLSSAYYFGVISASHLSGFLADTLGRKYILVRAVTLNVFAYILGSLAPNFWTFLALKIFSGIVTCPCIIAAIPFLGEYMPGKRRSQSVLICTSLSSQATLFVSLVGWLVLQQKWELDLGLVTFTPWRLFYLVCGLPSLLCAFLLWFTPESPKFLLTQGKKRDTMKVLQKVYSVNSGKVPQNYPVMTVSMDAGETVPPVQGKGAAGVFKHVYDQTVPLFKPPYVKNLLLCVTMFFVTLCCVNSLALWLLEVINRMAFYTEENHTTSNFCQMVMREPVTAKSFTADVNMNDSSPVVCDATIKSSVFLPSIIIGALRPTVMFFASLAIPYFDRRFLLMSVIFSCSCLVFLLDWIPDNTAIIVIFGGIPIVMGVCFNILTGLTIELFPTYIRAMAVSLVMICGRIGSIVGSALFSFLIDSQCFTLLRIMSAMLLCCATVPFFLKLQSSKPEQPPAANCPSRTLHI